MKAKAIKAAKKYLERKGYEILDNGSDFDLMAKDEDILVFVSVFWKEGGMPEHDGISCAEFESKALPCFLDNIPDECPVRYDEVSLAILSAERAFLRHHINALNN